MVEDFAAQRVRHRFPSAYDGWPGGMPTAFTGVLNNVGPALFIVGLLALTIQLAIAQPRRLAWWSPVLVALGFALITVDLDLLPAGGAALLLALLPMARRSHRTDQPPTAATWRSDNSRPTPIRAARVVTRPPRRSR
jgi:hypothetical protein